MNRCDARKHIGAQEELEEGKLGKQGKGRRGGTRRDAEGRGGTRRNGTPPPGPDSATEIEEAGRVH
jgi:hypothetical protein